jgi:hypothetical protein
VGFDWFLAAGRQVIVSATAQAFMGIEVNFKSSFAHSGSLGNRRKNNPTVNHTTDISKILEHYV